MQNAGNRAIEQAEEMVALERDASVAAIRRSLVEAGRCTCRDCGDPISAERRRAMPSAHRCADCQTCHERKMRRGW